MNTREDPGGERDQGSSIERDASRSLFYASRVPRKENEANVSPVRAGEAEMTAVGDVRREKVLLFRVAYLHLAIPLDRIRIVQRSEGIAPLPESPRNVVGLMELGPEESVPVVDLAHSLGIRTADEVGHDSGRKLPEPIEQPSTAKEHVLIYNSNRGVVGFLIDRAESVVEAELQPLPDALEDADSSLTGLARVSEGTAYLIDLERHVPQR